MGQDRDRLAHKNELLLFWILYLLYSLRYLRKWLVKVSFLLIMDPTNVLCISIPGNVDGDRIEIFIVSHNFMSLPRHELY